MTTDRSSRPAPAGAPALVSVCIPVYNGERYIGDAIRSIIGQRYPNIEIIIQDNASTDTTGDIVRSFAQRHPQISVQRNAFNVGMAPNWNIAINRAQGDFILLMSADDVMEENYLSTCLGVFKDNDVDVVTTNHFWLRGSTKKRRRKYVDEGAYRDFCAKVLIHNPFPIVFALFRRATVARMKQKDNLFNEAFPYTCDYELLLRLSLSGLALYYLEQPLASYRLHDANLSRQVMRMNRQAVMAILLHSGELKRRCRPSYQITLIRFILRVVRNLIWFQKFDRRLFTILWHEVIHAD
jgi:glycosyltransferase involved in cell wall biosynthesis